MAQYNEGGIHPKRIFKTPEELYKAFEEYKEDLKQQSSEWQKINYVGKDGKRVVENLKVPMTLEGFKRFSRANYGEVQHYFENTLDYYKEFCVICSRIRDEIRENQIIGGMLGLFNPSITQRLNNLTERQDITSKDEKIEGATVINVNIEPPIDE